MRHVILIMVLAFASLLTACSYMTDFAVVNESEYPIEVRYKVKNFPGVFAPPITPATITASQLSAHGHQQWKDLSSDQYRLNQDSRTVIVRVGAHEALLVARIHHYSGHEDPEDAKYFPVEEITIAGADGELKLTGQETRKTFSEVSRALYTLTYK
jgi:hypothetical protein